jgi:hypothetical protein
LQMGWIESRDFVLAHAKVGNTVEPDAAVGPGLHARPFDKVVIVLRFLVGEQLAGSFRRAAAAQVGIHHDVAVWHPHARVGRLPARPIAERHRFGLREYSILGVRSAAAPAARGDAILAVRMRRHDDGIGARLIWAEDVDA